MRCTPRRDAFLEAVRGGSLRPDALRLRVASADTGQLAGLEDEVQGLVERTTALRERAVRSHSALLMSECERIVKVVDSERLFLATRVQIFHLTGNPPDALVAQTVERADRANKLLSLVGRWFGPR